MVVEFFVKENVDYYYGQNDGCGEFVELMVEYVIEQYQDGVYDDCVGYQWYYVFKVFGQCF